MRRNRACRGDEICQHLTQKDCARRQVTTFFCQTRAQTAKFVCKFKLILAHI